MKRAFYRNPIVAAWMGQQWKMRFISKNREIPLMEIIHMWCPYGDMPKLYIHAKSMHLLEPQAGDIGCIDGEDFLFDGKRMDGKYPIALIETIHARLWMHNLPDGSVQMFDGDQEKVQIIRRDGKPFHYPEFEE